MNWVDLSELQVVNGNLSVIMLLQIQEIQFGETRV